MGVNLTPIIVKRTLSLQDIRDKSFAVDAFNILHQFLALIRDRKGFPLMDEEGRVTSHLVGLAFRTTRLISDFGMRLVFVFDGQPPILKTREIEHRRESRRRAEKEYHEALEEGDYHKAWSKAVQTGRLTSEGIQDAKRLLDLLGVPWVQALGEGEAQAAHITSEGEVWSTNSRDYDSLLYGSPRLVRYLTIQGKKWLPSKGISRSLEPELMELDEILSNLMITREQLIDISILIGTDYNESVKGVGPKTALHLIRKHGRIEELPEDIRGEVKEDIHSIRRQYLCPEIKKDYTLKFGGIDEEGLYEFLHEERSFSKERIDTLVSRMRKTENQRNLTEWMED
jgi:flap endonuclease-1